MTVGLFMEVTGNVCWTIPAMAGDIIGHVVRVVDGDTIALLTADHRQEKIRLAGIDAPERKQAFGKMSKKHLVSLVAGKMVSITYTKRDRWGLVAVERHGSVRSADKSDGQQMAESSAPLLVRQALSSLFFGYSSENK